MEVSKEIIEVLDYLGDKLGIAVDWTDKNVLPYVQQLCEKFIRWDITTSVFWIVVAVVLAIGGCLLIKLGKNFCKTGSEDDDYDCIQIGFVCYVFSVCIFVAALIMSGVQLYNIVKDLFMPELRLYEYAKCLISNNGR